ncbi:hypothetical protein GPECTOR_29g21 [Gonium pectorale]|uniref:Uncharacterized protein n=1 Tax=Gonium pectorale TaxID=33097 RepID=A0A150GEF4_GONPE|nr:hypothetical protein GPECTOR_29g21 [Gonium pectorale]|eukprot:KXZ48241.1 hypothetical protein GPECTOR_29g21 [Gonium pectorale]
MCSWGGSPQRQPPDAGPGGEDTSEQVEVRKRRALQSLVEQQLGGADPDRAALAVLLQRHGVVVRGGQAEAVGLIEALQAWKRGEWKPEP